LGVSLVSVAAQDAILISAQAAVLPAVAGATD